MRIGAAISILFALTPIASSQTLNAPDPSVREKWDFFAGETFSPLTPVAAAFLSAASQELQTAPKYGESWGAWAQRFGASNADIAVQNFFVDFAIASALHEDTRYVRAGDSHRFWSRVRHAAASSFVTRKDTGGTAFNWANLSGTAISAGVSNAYYPAASRSGGAFAINFSTSLVGYGLSNLSPEFMPDVHRWLQRRHLMPASH